ncbi:MAG: 30S ribosomal protein S27ae [Nanoarchaeota archaeon]|nr:30S ribosomal protein S27ae [Nanoarchaeota archaeon]
MAKKKVNNKTPSQVWKKYKIEGNKVSRSKYCPKCGPSSFLAEHKDRFVCGHCGYVEVKKKQ